MQKQFIKHEKKYVKQYFCGTFNYLLYHYRSPRTAFLKFHLSEAEYPPHVDTAVQEKRCSLPPFFFHIHWCFFIPSDAPRGQSAVQTAGHELISASRPLKLPMP